MATSKFNLTNLLTAVVGMLIVWQLTASPVIAQNASMLVAIFNGVPKTLTATTNGYLNVTVMGGSETLTEQAAPSAPAADNAIIYAQDNGAGKTQVCALFSSGAAQCFALQP